MGGGRKRWAVESRKWWGESLLLLFLLLFGPRAEPFILLAQPRNAAAGWLCGSTSTYRDGDALGGRVVKHRPRRGRFRFGCCGRGRGGSGLRRWTYRDGGALVAPGRVLLFAVGLAFAIVPPRPRPRHRPALKRRHRVQRSPLPLHRARTQRLHLCLRLRLRLRLRLVLVLLCRLVGSGVVRLRVEGGFPYPDEGAREGEVFRRRIEGGSQRAVG